MACVMAERRSAWLSGMSGAVEPLLPWSSAVRAVGGVFVTGPAACGDQRDTWFDKDYGYRAICCIDFSLHLGLYCEGSAAKFVVQKIILLRNV